MADLFDDDFFEIDEDLLNATGYFGQPNVDTGKLTWFGFTERQLSECFWPQESMKQKNQINCVTSIVLVKMW